MELWKDIKGYEGKYQVSNYGRVKSLARTIIKERLNETKYEVNIKEKILKECDNGNGYKYVSLGRCSGNKYIHRLVAESFIDKVEGLEHVNHIDNNRYNNNIDNLEWTNQQLNIKYKVNQNRQSKGETSANSKLKEHDVLEIRMLCEKNIPQRVIGAMYSITQTQVSSIKRKQSWNHV